MAKTKNKTLQIKNITKTYKQGDHEITILDDINLDVNEGEIIGILGRSGSGKSTFLRIIANLIESGSGQILYNNQLIEKADPKISMVFQSSGLVPWLTVFENVAIGLKEKSLLENVIKDRVIKAINLVGLHGYEEAYPKEMSGGMRQRVGFARALVISPEILLMDEAFSALDYLTANALKGDLLDLWFNRNISSLKSIIMVTHNIQEAVELCDRVIVFSSNPGRVVANIAVDLPHPRDVDSQKFHSVVEDLYGAMTSPSQKETEKNDAGDDAEHSLQKFYPQPVPVILLLHFLEIIKGRMVNDRVSIKLVAERSHVSHDELTKLIESLLLLNFIELDGNDIVLSSAGNILLEADNNSQKLIFKEHLVTHVPFIKEINHMLQDSGSISKKELLEILAKKFKHRRAACIVNATISWARYADLFAYDNIKDKLCLK